MTKYVIKAVCYYPNSIDGDSINGEYSGIYHTELKEAQKELLKAKDEDDVYTAWIDEIRE